MRGTRRSPRLYGHRHQRGGRASPPGEPRSLGDRAQTRGSQLHSVLVPECAERSARPLSKVLPPSSSKRRLPVGNCRWDSKGTRLNRPSQPHPRQIDYYRPVGMFQRDFLSSVDSGGSEPRNAASVQMVPCVFPPMDPAATSICRDLRRNPGRDIDPLSRSGNAEHLGGGEDPRGRSSMWRAFRTRAGVCGGGSPAPVDRNSYLARRERRSRERVPWGLLLLHSIRGLLLLDPVRRSLAAPDTARDPDSELDRGSPDSRVPGSIPWPNSLGRAI